MVIALSAVMVRLLSLDLVTLDRSGSAKFCIVSLYFKSLRGKISGVLQFPARLL